VPKFCLKIVSASQLTDISVNPREVGRHPETKVDIKAVKPAAIPLLKLLGRGHLLLSVHLLNLLLLLICLWVPKPHLQLLLLFLLIHLVVTCVLLLEFEVLLALADLLLKLAVTGDTRVVGYMAMACIQV